MSLRTLTTQSITMKLCTMWSRVSRRTQSTFCPEGMCRSAVMAENQYVNITVHALMDWLRQNLTFYQKPMTYLQHSNSHVRIDDLQNYFINQLLRFWFNRHHPYVSSGHMRILTHVTAETLCVSKEITKLTSLPFYLAFELF